MYDVLKLKLMTRKLFKMAGITWHESLSRAQQAELYALYIFLCNSSFSLSNKQAAFESAADGPHSWPIEKVTIEALKYIAEYGHARLLRRAHGTKRVDRARYMFVRHPLMSQNDLMKYFFDLDPVTLAIAKSEAGRHGHEHFSEQIHVPIGIFTKSGKGTKIYQPEFNWAVNTLETLQIPFNKFNGKIPKQRSLRVAFSKPYDHLAENTDQ